MGRESEKKSGSSIAGVVVIGGLAALAVWAFTGKKLQNLEVGFKSFASGIKFKFPNLNVPINIEIKNPNKQSFTLNEIYCDVYINGVKSTVLTYNKPVIIVGKAVTTISKVLIETEIFSTADKLLDMISKSVTIQIKGYLIADKLKFPINENVIIS